MSEIIFGGRKEA